jgi:hypothetical protein
MTRRPCAQCGHPFEPAKSWQDFCGLVCQERFADIKRKRGKVAEPFILAWRTGKRGATDDSRYALDQLAALADRWTAEDKLMKRNAMAVVRRKRLEGWRAADLDCKAG